ncbi:DLW-39 family protein [Amycolatopsis anabasis]|uniref:DLW-39 family protein n=1 Tax=Amycolatopsis anabasis TaxID=1840409 RepID=UPI00131C0D77|nr:DLW-39 family protein [Amycolatopsis anabasis]
MKKLLALAAIAGGVLFVIKRNKDAKAEADLWREATAPADRPLSGVSSNGSAPAKASSSDAASNN